MDETINVSMDQFQSMLAWQKDLIMLREEKDAWESEKKRNEKSTTHSSTLCNPFRVC